MAIIKGADISTWQRGIDYDKVAAHAAFVICKATQDTWTDSAFTTHLAAVKRRNLIPGAYHFLEAGPSSAKPAEQARAFVRAVRAANGGTLAGMLIALDWEPYDRKDSAGRVVMKSRPRWSHVRGWVDAFRELEPRHPLFIYSRANVIGSADLTKLPGPTYVWLAYWNGSPGSILPRKLRGVPVVIHQYGYLRPLKIDGNAFRGTITELRAYTRPKAAPGPDPDPPTPDPDPTPPPTPTPVTRWVMLPQGLPLRAAPQAPALLVATCGAPLLVDAGPSTDGTGPGGSPSGPWLAVHGLAAVRFRPPLMVEALPGTLGPESPLRSS